MKPAVLTVGVVLLAVVFAITGTFQLFTKAVATPGHFSLTYLEPVEIANLSCIGCSQATIFGRYEVKAVSLDAAYVMSKAGALKVAFGSGTVAVNERVLTPGCHVMNLAAGDKVAVHVRGLSLNFPSKNVSCEV